MTELGQLLGRTLVLVAHPDDEAVGCGALLQRMKEPAVIFATDGAPQDEFFWGKFGSRQRYGEVRENEARVALAAVRVAHVEFAGLPDQELFLRLRDGFNYLVEAVERIRPEALLTLAYEGGHPDHDSCSFLGAQLGRRFSLPVWEMPLYFRRTDGHLVTQTEFLDAGPIEFTIEPTPEEIARKRTMLAAYPSQGEFLKNFVDASEHFRPQVAYDYGRRPHEGILNYEAWGWRIRGEDVCAAFRQYLEQTRTEAA